MAPKSMDSILISFKIKFCIPDLFTSFFLSFFFFFLVNTHTSNTTCDSKNKNTTYVAIT